MNKNDRIPDKISMPEVEQALLRSGYLLEHRLETLLLEGHYWAEANSPFPDPQTQKDRELDIYAMTATRADPITLKVEPQFLFTVLLIECVNNPQPIALLTKKALLGDWHMGSVIFAGHPLNIFHAIDSDDSIDLCELTQLHRFHHYYKTKLASQFCSFKKKTNGDKEWFATHDEVQFDAFRKLSDAARYFSTTHQQRIANIKDTEINIEVYYPILVVQGQLLEALPMKKSVKIKSTKHILFKRSVVEGAESRDIFIDVVTERYFPKLLSIIDTEVDKLARKLKYKYQIMHTTLEKLEKIAQPPLPTLSDLEHCVQDN